MAKAAETTAKSGRAVTKKRIVGTDHQAELIKLIRSVGHVRNIYRVFNDFLEMTAIAISNCVDVSHRDERERRYMELINAYDEKSRQFFPKMLFHLTEALEEKARNTGPEDVLGPIFHELELHNKYRAQFFTPQNISDMMAMMICGGDAPPEIQENGFIDVNEPTCGSGVMLTSVCKAMAAAGLDYHTQLLVTANDVDLKCVHMTYLQLALYGVPAVVIHGDSLSLKEYSRWYTPAYILNGWIWRGKCVFTTKPIPEDELIKRSAEPMYAALRQVAALFADDKAAGNEERTVIDAT